MPAPRKRVQVTVIDQDGKHEQHRSAASTSMPTRWDAFVAACGGAEDPRIETGVANMAVLDAVRRACNQGLSRVARILLRRCRHFTDEFR